MSETKDIKELFSNARQIQPRPETWQAIAQELHQRKIVRRAFPGKLAAAAVLIVLIGATVFLNQPEINQSSDLAHNQTLQAQKPNKIEMALSSATQNSGTSGKEQDSPESLAEWYVNLGTETNNEILTDWYSNDNI